MIVFIILHVTIAVQCIDILKIKRAAKKVDACVVQSAIRNRQVYMQPKIIDVMGSEETARSRVKWRICCGETNKRQNNSKKKKKKKWKYIDGQNTSF